MSSPRRRSSGRPTLDEVAARAGVGRGTASRVVNSSPQVSPETRTAVLRAIEELGYVPNRAARTLVTRRTDSVALVVSESQERVFAEPFFAAIVRGVSAELSTTPIQLWLSMAQSVAERERVEHHLTAQHVDGVMLLSLHDDDSMPMRLADTGLPTVLGGRPSWMLSHPEHGSLCFVDVDNVGGARSAVEYLLGRGRRVVAAIAGPQDMGVGVARLEGYRQALLAHGLPVTDDLIHCGDFREPSGSLAARELLATRPDIDALFAASDLMAVGAIRALRASGIRVPEDVAVVGFEDSPVARQVDPPLTTVHQEVEGMGRAMARLLLARISGEDAGSIVLDTHLVERGSA